MEQLALFTKELGIAKVLRQLKKHGSDIPDDFRDSVIETLNVISELFGTSMPDVDPVHPDKTLRQVIKELSLGNLLQARAGFRLWRMVRATPDGVISWSLLQDDDGRPFPNETKFIEWFCQQSGMARSGAFVMLRTLDRLVELGADEDYAYELYTRMPTIVETAMRSRSLLMWHKAELTGINEELVKRVLDDSPNILDSDRENILRLAEDVNNPHIQPEPWKEKLEELRVAVGPAILNILEELTLHQNPREAGKKLRHDIQGLPEISYDYNALTQEIRIEVVGTRYPYTLIPSRAMPPEVVMDLSRKLGFTFVPDLDR
jgi:hypothetical protein